jgi:hypothetical protein
MNEYKGYILTDITINSDMSLTGKIYYGTEFKDVMCAANAETLLFKFHRFVDNDILKQSELTNCQLSEDELVDLIVGITGLDDWYKLNVIKDSLTGEYWRQSRASGTQWGRWSKKLSSARVFKMKHHSSNVLKALLNDKSRQPVLVEVQLVEVVK